MTGANVYQGLAGVYLIKDPKETPLRLPRGPYEIPLVIQDRTFDAAGQFVYNLDDMALEMGMMGDVVLVNGKVQPYLEVAARKYRFRILNGSNSRRYTLALANGQPLIQIGTDGGLLQRPKSLDSINIAPAERADVIIDFTGLDIGTDIILRNSGGEGRTGSIMLFRVTKPRGKENAVIPAFLAPWEEIVPTPFPGAESVPTPTTRTFTLNRQPIDGVLTWVINGYGFDTPGRPVPTPKLDSIEYWKFINPTNHPHPMHLHLVQFQIVNVNGVPQDPSDFGWKDTVVIPPGGGEITLAVKFSGYTGKYVFHCHNLEHEDYAMMSEFEVIP
jgi:spore coat protein A